MQQNGHVIRPTNVYVSASCDIILRYIRFNVHNQNSRPKMQDAWRLLLSVLCVALVVACGTIQAVHVHPQGDISHPDCALCATAHLSVQLAETPVTLHPVAPVISAVEAFVPPTLTQTLSTFALFTRPPPVDSVLA
jgi:hypothetical protein